MKAMICAATVAAALFLSGCGGVIGSCSQSNGTSMICVDYDQNPAGAQALQEACENGGSTWSASACPSANRAGRCKVSVSAAGITLSSTTNYYSPVTTQQAETQCDAFSSGGATVTFTAN